MAQHINANAVCCRGQGATYLKFLFSEIVIEILVLWDSDFRCDRLGVTRYSSRQLCLPFQGKDSLLCL